MLTWWRHVGGDEEARLVLAQVHNPKLLVFFYDNKSNGAVIVKT